MHGKYSKQEDYDLFGYTYIPAEPDMKEKEEIKTSQPKSTTLEKVLQDMRSGKCVFKFVDADGNER